MSPATARRRFLQAFGLMGVGSAALFPRLNAGELQTPDESIAAIRAVLARQEADWNKGDLDAFLTGYWKSPKVVFQSGGDRHDGWDAMADRYRKRYKAEGKAMGKVAFSRVEIELLGPEAALVRGAWSLTLPDGAHPGGLFTLIFRKFPDGWKIIHDHTSAAAL